MKQETNTKKKYRKYDTTFKAEAIRQLEQGRSVTERSASLGVGQSLFHRWKKESKGGSTEPSAETRQLRKEMKRLREENDILKKSIEHFQPSRLDRYRFIERYEDAHRITLLCELMGVSRSSYYDRFERDSVTLPQSDISWKVVAAFLFHKRRYGTRRLVSELADEGIQAGRQTVRTILADHGLRAIQPKSFVPKTTQSHPNLKGSPNILLEREPASAPDGVYVGDIIYLPLVNGKFAYLATLQDVFTKNIVGWDIADHMREELVLNALEKAIIQRRPKAGLIVHTDGGGQYASKAFRKKLTALGFLQSMTRRDNHYDNAQAESLFSRFKAELLEDGVFLDVEDAKQESFDYLEGYYNTGRRHSSLGNNSPLNFERAWRA
jgi:putative transposase